MQWMISETQWEMRQKEDNRYFTTALHKTVSDAIISAWKENGGQDYEIQTMH